MAASVQQLQTLFATPSSQCCVEAANWQKPDTDGPRVHTQTATMWNNVNETDKEEFTVIYETVEEEILSKTEVSEVVKPVKKVHRKRKAKTRQG